nr:MAG TPA: hypothetical protein [Caudoviricetes sp.]DAY20530.1 MAG TPA: hypothetical protein [Caudoviricetes sp.]
MGRLKIKIIVYRVFLRVLKSKMINYTTDVLKNIF